MKKHTWKSWFFKVKNNLKKQISEVNFPRCQGIFVPLILVPLKNGGVLCIQSRPFSSQTKESRCRVVVSGSSVAVSMGILSRCHHLDIQIILWGQRCSLILLMVQKSGVHQVRLVVHPIIYKVLYIPGGAGCLPSTVSKQKNLFIF